MTLKSKVAKNQIVELNKAGLNLKSCLEVDSLPIFLIKLYKINKALYPIELFRDFHSQAVEGRFPASARALYNFFLGELNNRFWTTEQLTYSERELAELTQIPKSSVNRAVKFLCDRGFVKTYADKTKTRKVYQILLGQTRTSFGPDADKTRTSFAFSNYAHAKDIKTEDAKTQKTTATRTRGKKM